MIPGRPSRTALRVAMRRAAHQLLDRPPVFEDPLALSILDDASRRELEAASADGPDRGLRAFMAVRSRLAEDLLAESRARQYVVLGAGLDTFGCRNPSDLRVFEVDAPATQAWKRELLARAAIPIPKSLTFAPVDFETETLPAGLASAGFDPGAPTFFSWLGVVPYLTREAALGTLRFVASLHASVVFDYALPRASLSVTEQIVFDAIASRVEKTGEPFRLFFAPEELRAELSALGFSRVEDFDAAALNARYFANRADGLALRGNLGHLVHAAR